MALNALTRRVALVLAVYATVAQVRATPVSTPSAHERAQQETDKVFQWIRQHGERTATHTPAASAPRAGRRAPARVASTAEVDGSASAPLVPLHRPQPAFPPELLRTLRRGAVQVGFTVLPDGTVTQAEALSAPHPRLAPIAVQAVLQWRFQPIPHAQRGVADLGFSSE